MFQMVKSTLAILCFLTAERNQRGYITPTKLGSRVPPVMIQMGYITPTISRSLERVESNGLHKCKDKHILFMNDATIAICTLATSAQHPITASTMGCLVHKAKYLCGHE